jgi:lysozyme family protein
MTFDELEADYANDLATMKITAHDADLLCVANNLMIHYDRFEKVELACRVPALWLMPVFEREGPSFDAYFGNGDPLSRPTTHVPKGRGPFSSWEDGVVDSLTLDHITACPVWTWERACYMWESWNGFGPRLHHGRPSGYLWSGTSIYQGGKYIADGVWSRGTWDKQLGTVAIAKKLAAVEPKLLAGFMAPDTKSTTVAVQTQESHPA